MVNNTNIKWKTLLFTYLNDNRYPSGCRVASKSWLTVGHAAIKAVAKGDPRPGGETSACEKNAEAALTNDRPIIGATTRGGQVF